MSKPFANPFFEADMSKLFDMSKMTGDFRMPSLNPENYFNAQRRNIEAFTALNQSIMESVQSFWRRQADLSRQAFEESMQTASAIASCPSPEEKVIRQAEASKAAMDKCLANMRDITETIAKCNSQTMEAVSTRLNESLDELRGMMNSTSRAA